MTALLPALLAVLFLFWSGTFHGGATSLGAGTGNLALCAFALIATVRLRDPLRLGRGAEVLVWAFVAAIAASALASPVPRAALEPVALLPALLLAPAAIERMWRDAQRRLVGRRSLALVALAVATAGLGEAAAGPTWRAAAPLGHHGALALALLLLLPFAATTLRDRGVWRVVGGIATAASVAALLTTRSLVGAALLVVQAAMLLLASWGRSREPEAPAATAVRPASTRWSRATAWALAALVGLTAVLHAPRLLAIVSGQDPSVAARGAYFAAGLDGIRQRPALGWGPGSVGWTIGEHLRPVPGSNPPGEIVSYLHFLPLDLAYQLGVAGALLAAGVAVAFLVARRRERATCADPLLRRASLAALVPGIAAFCLSGFPPLAAPGILAAIAAGAALASRAPAASVAGRAAANVRLGVALYAVAALAVLSPARWAQRSYEAARRDPAPLEALENAAQRDGAFPLYAARRAWAAAGMAGGDLQQAAAEALRAAERAPGVAALWLAAGLLGVDAGASWSGSALRRACDLDPFGALAPYRLMSVESDAGAAAAAGARALLAEPRLAAAVEWNGRAALYDRVLEGMTLWPGVDPEWRRELVATLAMLPAPRGLRTRSFFLELDGEPQTSLSLFVFRRLPWRASLGVIDLDLDRLRLIPFASAALRADTAPWAFPKNGCRAAEPPG
ncbi:MAG TPA: hypothetical protein VMS86_03925 [Thermoanaerobaculia bacterium]|nr:hypothetical protein [Thermoanaerobaculia bacterium]